MEMRTKPVDIEKILDEIWTRFISDMEQSVKCCDVSGSGYTTYTQLFNETYEDGRACKYCLDVLRWCKLISDDECSDMALKVDEYIEGILAQYEQTA